MLTPRTVIAGCIAFIVLLLAASAAMHFGTLDTTTPATVTDKERIVSGSGENQTSKWLIFTDQEVFQNSDSRWALKFNSADFQGRIQVGQTCTFTVVGWRVPFMSMYRNIIDYDCA